MVLGSKSEKIGKGYHHSRSRVYSAIKQMENKYLQLTRVIRKCETKERWLIGSSTKQGQSGDSYNCNYLTRYFKKSNC